MLEGFDFKTCSICGATYACSVCPRCGGRGRIDENPLERKPSEPAFKGRESDLQADIERFLEQEGLFFFHDRSRKKNEPGFPDLVIAVWMGRTLWWELKTKSGALSHEQKQTRIRLMALGHEFEVIRSLRQAQRIIGEAKSRRAVAVLS